MSPWSCSSYPRQSRVTVVPSPSPEADSGTGKGALSSKTMTGTGETEGLRLPAASREWISRELTPSLRRRWYVHDVLELMGTTSTPLIQIEELASLPPFRS